MFDELAYLRLSKTALMKAPEGTYLASNTMHTPWISYFEETVTPMAERHKQWQRIVDSRANHRMCRISGTRLEYMVWLSRMVKVCGLE